MVGAGAGVKEKAKGRKPSYGPFRAQN